MTLWNWSDCTFRHQIRSLWRDVKQFWVASLESWSDISGLDLRNLYLRSRYFMYFSYKLSNVTFNDKKRPWPQSRLVLWHPWHKPSDLFTKLKLRLPTGGENSSCPECRIRKVIVMKLQLFWCNFIICYTQMNITASYSHSRTIRDVRLFNLSF